LSQCFRCKRRGNFNFHHIDGNGSQLPIEKQNNYPDNLITLCPSCHDIVEGICSKCFARNNCNKRKFKECWNFEDALPPIYFKTAEDVFIEGLDMKEGFNAKCPKCESTNLARISKWTYDGVYKHSNYWIALYKCRKCGQVFKRRLENELERALDNKKVSIEIEDWDLVARI